MCESLSDCRETLLEVSDDVIDVLRTDRETDRVLIDAYVVELFLGKLR